LTPDTLERQTRSLKTRIIA